MKGNFNELIAGDQPVLIDFYADWCGPCKVLGPILQDVASDVGDQARIVKVDVDKNPTLAQKFQVRGIPTMIIFKNGAPVWRQSGVLPKEQIVEAIRANR